MAQDEAWQSAEREIEQARLSGTTELHLTDSQLTSLPESLGNLKQMQQLHLACNQLTSLPESLGNLTQLQKLNLASNQLTSLPESLGNLKQLQRLSSTNNQLTSLPESVGNLTQLQELDLSYNQLTSLPESLGNLKQLQELDLRYNQLTSLPESLRNLKQLQQLDLRYNQLTSLPESLGNLTKLQVLHLAGNQLTSLPESLGNLTKLQVLHLVGNQLTSLPESLGNLKQLQKLISDDNQLTSLPESLGNLKQLQVLHLAGNQLTSLPESLGNLKQLQKLISTNNQLTSLPESLGNLTKLQSLYLSYNQLTSLPESLGNLTQSPFLGLADNPLNPELAAAYEDGFNAVMRYLRAKAEAQVVLNEAKLILIGEGEVGKSCLLGALREDPWEEGRASTHGIEIMQVKVTDPDSGKEITLNGWDFGGQRVYRPTHQLFFSAPAVYLVVWKPREGSQAGAVKEWINLVKHREPDAKILVVATHGGPKERQPDIDRQEIWDLFGKDTVIEFLLVESKPNEETQERKGIAELQQAIARVAAGLPEMGRAVPKRWEDAQNALEETGEAYLPLNKALEICHDLKMDADEAKGFVRISHRLGHLIHYEHDPLLRDIVVLKPDWLATAMSYVLDDEETREKHGLVEFARLQQLWKDATREEEFRYPSDVHPVFLRLMDRFDLSYRVTGSPLGGEGDQTSLIAQLVTDVRPKTELACVWPDEPEAGDEQQSQICRIVDTKQQSSPAEGLFYQLIVRLHKFSMGRTNFINSVHWQRGLVLDDDYNGRALLEHIGNDIRITVRAAYPGSFLAVLTRDVKWLVESFWEGLRCDVMVPCIKPCGNEAPGTGLYEVEKLIASKKRGRPEYPCQDCGEWQDIDGVLLNAPAARRTPIEVLLGDGFDQMKSSLDAIRLHLARQDTDAQDRFKMLDRNDQRILSKADEAFDGLMQALTDEAKEGPRLFSFELIDPGFFDRPKWVSEKFRLTLWCEHSRLPLPAFNDKGDKSGVYELTISRDWFVKAAPFLKVLTGTLSLVVPIASSATKLMLDEATYKGIEKQLDLGQKSLDSVLKGGQKAGAWLGHSDAPDLNRGGEARAQGADLRQLHVWLKEKDPGFGGLVRVQNKRQEFLWVHPQFETEY